MNRHPGLSRIEVLVVLLVLILLTGLVLVGINRVRSAAALANCGNNLKLLALATQMYQDNAGHLPPLTDLGANAPTDRGLLSCFASVHPYIEATPVCYRPEQSTDRYHADSSVTFTFPHKGELFTQHGGLANHALPYFLDPADPTAHELRDVRVKLPDGTTGYYATGSYAANGLLPWGIEKGPDAFPRGAANTVLLAERPQVCETAEGEVIHNLWGLGVYSPQMPAFATLTPSKPPGLWSTGQVVPVEPLLAEKSADGIDRIRVRIGRSDADLEPLDFPTSIQMIRGKQPCDPRLPGGLHPEGMQVTMADGSVRLFGSDTSPWVFWTACLPGKPAD